MKTKYFLLFCLVFAAFFCGKSQELEQIRCFIPENEVDSRGIAGFSNKISTWKTQIIPYEFEPNLSQKIQFDFFEAVKNLEANTHLCFVPRRTESTVLLVKNYVGNYSFANLQENSINIGGTSAYVITHEICHLLGMSHEHQRPNRDSFIYILWQNVNPQFESAFTIFGEKSDSMTQVYDFESIMHYPINTFTQNGEPTIKLKQPSNQIVGGQFLSKLDTAFLKRIYPKIIDCQKADIERPPTRGFNLIPQNEACTFELISVDNQAEFADSFEWTADLGQPATGNDRTFSTYFSTPGLHRIWMKSTNSFGSNNWAKDILVKNCAEISITKLFPNPTSGALNLTLSQVFPPEFQISIYAENGQLLSNAPQKRDFDGQNTFNFTLPTTIADGNYFLKIDFLGKSATSPFVFVR
jgi:Astacin (Peptidase family M12A)